MSGTLYLVSTPIGHPEDITYRAVRILASVDLVAAENPGTAKLLLDRYKAETPITSYPTRQLDEKIRVLVRRLQEGQDLALMCDCGTPVLWDPGVRLVQAAVGAGIRVVPVPGPSAGLVAIPVSGFTDPSVHLHGPLPRTTTASRRLLERYRTQPGTLVLFVPERTLTRTLELIHRVLGKRRVLIAADVTKPTERFFRGRIDDVQRDLGDQTITGELTVLIEGKKTADPPRIRKQR